MRAVPRAYRGPAAGRRRLGDRVHRARDPQRHPHGRALPLQLARFRRAIRMPTIDEMPLDWYFRPGGEARPSAISTTAMSRRPTTWRPSSSGSATSCSPWTSCWSTRALARDTATTTTSIPAAASAARATHYLTERGVRVTGIDGWSWDAPFSATRANAGSSRAIPRSFGRGTTPGIDTPYCHMEKLQAPGGAAALRLHGCLLPLQDQGGIRRLDQGRRALRLTPPHPRFSKNAPKSIQ